MHHADEIALFEIETSLKQLLFKNPESYFYNGNLVVEDGGKGDVLNLKALLTSINTKLDTVLSRDKKEITDVQLNERLSVIKNQIEVLQSGVYASEKTTSRTVANDLIVQNFDVDVSELLKQVGEINEKVQKLSTTGSGTTGGGNDDNGSGNNNNDSGNGGSASSGSNTINQDDAVIAWLRAPGILQTQFGINYNKSFVSDSNSNLLVTAVSDSLLLIKLTAQGKEGKKFFGAIPLITCQLTREGNIRKSPPESGTSEYPMFDSSIIDYEYFEDDFANESGIQILLNTSRNSYKTLSKTLAFNVLLFKPAKSSQSAIAFSSDKIPNHNPHGDVDIFEHEKGEYIVRFEGIDKPGLCVAVGFDNCDVNFVGFDSNSRGTTVKLKVEKNYKPADGHFGIAYITDEKAFLNSKNDLQVGLYSNLESEFKINKTVGGDELGKVTGSFDFSTMRGTYHIRQNQPFNFSDSNSDPLESIVFSQLCDLNANQRYMCLRDEFTLLVSDQSLITSPTLQVKDLKGSYIKLALGKSK